MIRLATEFDITAILDMAQEFWVHTQFSEPFDRDHTRGMVEMSISQGLMVVADDGEVFGFISAIKSPLLGSPFAQMATELAWWVNPAKRGKMVGVNLIRFLERLCIEQEVRYLNLAFMETSMPKQVEKMYLKLGYTLQETVYTKVLYGSSNSSGGGGRSSSLQ